MRFEVWRWMEMRLNTEWCLVWVEVVGKVGGRKMMWEEWGMWKREMEEWIDLRG